jgi:hypothetical protein
LIALIINVHTLGRMLSAQLPVSEGCAQNFHATQLGSISSLRCQKTRTTHPLRMTRAN